MQIKSKDWNGIVFINANPRYAGRLDDPPGYDTIMLMQKVGKVMTVNQEMKDVGLANFGPATVGSCE